MGSQVCSFILSNDNSIDWKGISWAAGKRKGKGKKIKIYKNLGGEENQIVGNFIQPV